MNTIKLAALIAILSVLTSCASRETKEPSANVEQVAEGVSAEDSTRTATESDEARSTKPAEGKPVPSVAQISKSNNAFALDMHRALPQENVVYSPHSVSTLLAAAHAGANGRTKDEIGAILHYTTEPPAYALYRELQDSLASREQDADRGLAFRLRSVNAIWGANDFKFLTPFLRTAETDFLMHAKSLDFKGAPEDARKTINASISESTSGKIPELLAQGVITPATRAVLTNAVYFNAPWSKPFSTQATKPGTFNTLKGDAKQASFMSTTDTMRYAQKDGYQVLEIPYVGEQVVALVILPEAGQYKDVDAGLTLSQLEHFTGSLDYQRVNVRLPKFELRTQLDLSTTLGTMGLKDFFDPEKADFSAMSDEPVHISAVVHEGFIRVDEAGTEAAAATAMMAVTGMPAPATADFNADRPFTFMIMDKPTGQILFVARVVDI